MTMEEDDLLMNDIIFDGDGEEGGAAGTDGGLTASGTGGAFAAGSTGADVVDGAAGAQDSGSVAQAAAARARMNAERLQATGQNVAAAQGRVTDAVSNMNSIAEGNVKGMGDILAQYGPKESAEEAAARKRRELNTGRILALTNMLQGVANVVTASSGSNGRYAGTVDVVKPYQQGIMAAETERKANDVAREKARQAYIDKALSRAKIDYDAAQKDLGAARTADEAERKRQAAEYEKGEQRRHDMTKALIASNDKKYALKLNLAQKEKFHLDDVALKRQANSIRQQAVDVQREKAKNGGSGTGKKEGYDTFFYGGGTDKKIEINKNYWSGDKGGTRTALVNVIEKQSGGKEFLKKWMAEHYPDKTYTQLKANEFNDLVKDYVFDENEDSPVVKALYDIARVKEEDRPKADFFGDESGKKSGETKKLLFE